jgi:hypothetical protein
MLGQSFFLTKNPFKNQMKFFIKNLLLNEKIKLYLTPFLFYGIKKSLKM